MKTADVGRKSGQGGHRSDGRPGLGLAAVVLVVFCFGTSKPWPKLRGAQWYGVRLVTCAKRVHAEYRDHAAGLITHAQMVLRLADTRVQVHRLLQAAATRAPAIRARRVAAGILKQEHKLWTFLDHKGVAPTNNLAERCARMGRALACLVIRYRQP